MTADRSWLDEVRPHTATEPAGRPELLEEVAGVIGDDLVRWGVALRADEFDDARVAEAVVLSALLAVRTGEVVSERLTVEADLATRTAVARGMAVETIVQAVQRTYAVVARELASLATAPQARQLMADLFRGLDHLSTTLIAQFTAERERWVRSAAFARRELVESVLDGGHGADRLGYDLTRHHLALVFWADGHSTRELETAAADVLVAAGCTARLLVVAGPSVLWAWGSRTRPARVELPQGSGVHVAAGLAAEGVDGFRSSHRQAVKARELARLTQRPPGLHAYEDLALTSLAAENLDAAAEFVRHELGPLTEAANADLRRTLKAYLDHDRGLSAAAADLHVAKNTVLYRVRRAEQLLARPVGAERLRLHVALHLADVLGPAVLR
ncbi:PucR family transcriptional regulator [Lentzea sp. NPDC058450]|uniref:PucR family transcriptional regulator n=1 Tax=Lentzea sp. NPDC058450 TaxID=3346505 RepID=UPI00364AE11B